MPAYERDKGTRVVQVSNISPSASREQLYHMFGYLGRIDELKVYPSETNALYANAQSKLCYIKFDDYDSVAAAQHMTNTVFIDRALICVPVQEGKIPDEEQALKIGGPALPGQRQLPPNIINQIQVVGSQQLMVTIDPSLAALGLPAYPPLPSNTDATKMEEIRRTIYVGNITKEAKSDEIVEFFGEKIGEVMYLRMAGDESAPTRYAYIEFTNQHSVLTALQNNGIEFMGNKLRIQHSTVAIIKPRAKTLDMAKQEVEEALKKAEASNPLIAKGLDADEVLRRFSATTASSRSPSRRRSKSRSRGRSERRRSRSKSARRSSQRVSSSRRSPSRRRSRSRDYRRSRSKDKRSSRRRSTSKSRRSPSPPKFSRSRRSETDKKYEKEDPRQHRHHHHKEDKYEKEKHASSSSSSKDKKRPAKDEKGSRRREDDSPKKTPSSSSSRSKREESKSSASKPDLDSSFKEPVDKKPKIEQGIELTTSTMVTESLNDLFNTAASFASKDKTSQNDQNNDKNESFSSSFPQKSVKMEPGGPSLTQQESSFATDSSEKTTSHKEKSREKGKKRDKKEKRKKKEKSKKSKKAPKEEESSDSAEDSPDSED